MSVLPPSAHALTWCTWQSAGGRPQIAHPWSRAARARRWALVAIRTERPKANGSGWLADRAAASPDSGLAESSTTTPLI